MLPDPLLKSNTFIDLNVEPKEEDMLDEQEAQNGNVEQPVPNQVEPCESDYDKSELHTTPEVDILNCAHGLMSMQVVEPTAESLLLQQPERGPEVALDSVTLLEGWLIDSRVRCSSATAGLIDTYYVEPVSGHRFQSEKEVLHSLETGSMHKRKLNPDADVVSSEIPGGHKQKKSVSSPKSSAPLNFDFDNVPESVNWVLTDASLGIWTPFIGGAKVPESTQHEWAAAFEYRNTRKSGGTMYEGA